MTDPQPDEAITVKFIEAHKAEVDKIVQLESEADSLTGEADNYRAQAAGIIVALLETGATERVVAEAIGKSSSHVHHAKMAWRMIQEDSTIPDFNTAYKRAKSPASQRANANDGSQDDQGEPGADQEPEASPFPPWSKQVRELKRLAAEMLDQAGLRQIRQLSGILEKALRATLAKGKELQGTEDDADTDTAGS